jgi:hypothetical protein
MACTKSNLCHWPPNSMRRTPIVFPKSASNLGTWSAQQGRCNRGHGLLKHDGTGVFNLGHGLHRKRTRAGTTSCRRRMTAVRRCTSTTMACCSTSRTCCRTMCALEPTMARSPATRRISWARRLWTLERAVASSPCLLPRCALLFPFLFVLLVFQHGDTNYRALHLFWAPKKDLLFFPPCGISDRLFFFFPHFGSPFLDDLCPMICDTTIIFENTLKMNNKLQLHEKKWEIEKGEYCTDHKILITGDFAGQI